MAPPRPRRGLVVGALLVVLCGLCVWYGTLTPAPALGDYPSTDAVTQTPTDYIGSQISLGGWVVATEPVTIAVDHGTTTHEFTVTHLTRPVDRGDSLWVFGTLTTPSQIRASKTVVTPPWRFTYMYVVSALAGLWVLVRLLGQWRLDSTAGLVRRTNPHQPLSHLRSWHGDTGDDDA